MAEGSGVPPGGLARRWAALLDGPPDHPRRATPRSRAARSRRSATTAGSALRATIGPAADGGDRPQECATSIAGPPSSHRGRGRGILVSAAAVTGRRDSGRAIDLVADPDGRSENAGTARARPPRRPPPARARSKPRALGLQQRTQPRERSRDHEHRLRRAAPRWSGTSPDWSWRRAPSGCWPTGEPVALERLAAASGRKVEEVETALDAQRSAERDEQGRLVGPGLTMRPTSHRFTVRGRTLYTWCASDALMFPVVLGRPGVVESPCPRTGQPIRIGLAPDAVEGLDPPTAVVSAVRPIGLTDLHSSVCRHGHFFASRAAAARWATSTPPAMSTPSGAPSGWTERSSSSSAGMRPQAGRRDRTGPAIDTRHAQNRTGRHRLPDARGARAAVPRGRGRRTLVVGGVVRTRPRPRRAPRAHRPDGTRGASLRAPAASLHRPPRAPAELRVIVALLSNRYTGDAVALFYAATLLVAAWRGQAGCEVTVLSNWILRRDDQVGCPVFADRRRRGGAPAPAADTTPGRPRMKWRPRPQPARRDGAPCGIRCSRRSTIG
jgi:alkylmercury lyase